MYRDFKITVFIPCYNEEKGIGAVIGKIPEFVDEIMVVDNCSTDNTAKIAFSKGARVIKNEINLGYGGSYRKCLPLVVGDIIVTADGDGTYPVCDSKRLLDILIDQDLDFISASRFPLSKKGAMCFRNRFGNSIFTTMVNFMFGLHLNDGQSGMWVFKKNILSKMKLTSNKMSFSNEIKIEAFRSKIIKAKEVIIPYEQRIGTSKLYPLKDGVEMLIFMIRKKFS